MREGLALQGRPSIKENIVSERKLYVIAVISNPVRYQSRYKLYLNFELQMLANPDVVLITVEQSFGDRPFVVTSADNPNHIQIRCGAESEIWVKESLVNIGFRNLDRIAPHWKYGAWIDADVEFLRPNWATETIEALQHYRIVQPWVRAIDQGPYHAPIGQAESFCYSYWQQNAALASGQNPGRGYAGKEVNGVATWHPGYAWAIRRDCWEKVGPLIDWTPMGAGDHHMAWAFAGKIENAVDSRYAPGYHRRAQVFQKRCDKFVDTDIGFVEGTIVHHWHGKKRERYYVERAKTLLDVKFDPDTDVTYNHAGLLVHTGHNPKLRDALRRYMRSRNEDSIDVG